MIEFFTSASAHAPVRVSKHESPAAVAAHTSGPSHRTW
jgi:hypothetical protein